MKQTVHWIQLSDLHIKENTEWYLLKNAYKKIVGSIKLSFIIITGDLHNFGDSYDKTRRFLDDLTSAVGIPRDRVFIVPGNHDSAEFANKKLFIKEIDEKIADDPDCYVEYLPFLSNAFETVNGYSSFADNFYGADGSNPGYAGVSFTTWENKLNIIRLNSALVSNGNNSRKQIVDIRTLGSYIEDPSFDAGLPAIVVCHHHFEDLHFSHRQRLIPIFARLNVKAFLCGDVHEEGATTIGGYNNIGGGIPCVSCGKAAIGALSEKSDSGFILYRCDLNHQRSKVTVVPYRWESLKLVPTKKLADERGNDFHFYLDMKKTELAPNAAKKEAAKKTATMIEPEDAEPPVRSIWLPDAELAEGEQTRFGTYTSTDRIKNILSGTYWGISSVKGIGKTFVLQIKRIKTTRSITLPFCPKPSKDNNWGTECVSLDIKIVNMSKLRNHNNIVALWKYSLICYCLCNILNRDSDVPDSLKAQSAVKRDEMAEKLMEYRNSGKLSQTTYEFCTMPEYTKLQDIITNIFDAANWIDIISDDYGKLRLLNYKLEEYVRARDRDCVTVLIDKTDQAINQTNCEPPTDCVICEKIDNIRNCADPEKSDAFCTKKMGHIEESDPCYNVCCYTCERYGAVLRIYNSSNMSPWEHVSLWQYFQLSLVQAVFQIKNDFSGTIKVFYTLRQEAYYCEESLFGEHRNKINMLTERLYYTKEEHRKIFLDCIRNQDPRLLLRPDLQKTPGYEEEAFLGIKRLTHSYVDDGESLFECIYRHSFDRSRDIQYYGEYLTSRLDEIRSKTTEKERMECIKDKIREFAAKLAYSNEQAVFTANKSYYHEKIKLIPNYWSKQENIEKLFRMITKNLMFKEETMRICAAFNEREDCEIKRCSMDICEKHPFSMLYKLGLVGTITQDESKSDQVAQFFHNSSDITYIKEKYCLHSDYQMIYLIHPALTKSIEKNIRSSVKHFKGFIIGKDNLVKMELLNRLFDDKKNMTPEEFDAKYYS